MKKKALAFIMALALVVSAFGGFKTSASSLNEDKMREVLLTVKEKLNIGNDYENFTQDFYENGSGKTIWYFYWSNEDGSESVNVTADNKGRIMGYHLYDSKNRGNVAVPNYTKNEAIPFAEAFIRKAAAELDGKVKCVSSSYRSYSQEYTLRFIRVENGIDMADNYANVTVNSIDGSVSAFSTNWEYDVKIPAAEKLISTEAAKEKLDSAIDMKLEYRLGWDSKTGEPKVFLAYAPSRGYASVNAKSGRVYTTKHYDSEEDYMDDADEENSFEAADTATGSIDKNAGLSDAEISKLEELKDLISAEEAVKMILNNPYLYKEEGVSYAEYVHLYSGNDGSYVWNINLQDERPFEDIDFDKYYDGFYYRSSIYAEMDAKTGEILSYFASVRDMYEYPEEELANLKVNYTKKQCKAVFTDFVKSVNADKFAETKLSDTSKNLIIGYDAETNKSTYGGYAFTYTRYHENIPFSANSIYGTVEAITGKVTSYNLNWTDVEFPSSKDMISEKAAYDAYVDARNLDLAYELVTVYSDNYTKSTAKVRLVYGLKKDFRGYIDALTGKHVDYSGNEYVEKKGNFEYTDIAGSKYERTILLLAGMGIGFEGSEFKPEQTITRGELLALITKNYFYYPSYSAFDYDIVTIDSDDADPEADKKNKEKLTRETAAETVIEYLGMGELAKLDIYKTGYADEASIKKVGAVALAKGLGLITAAKGNSFKPSQKFTRGEAAELVMNIMTMNSIY